MDISVVIPVNGRYEYLSRSLLTLLRQSARSSDIDADLIVVDNAKDPALRSATQERCAEAAHKHLKRGRLRYVSAVHRDSGHCNCGYAKNVGLRMAEADIVMFSDADVLHVSQTLERHCKWHHRGRSIILHGFCRDCPAEVPLDLDALQVASRDPGYPIRMASWTGWVGGPCFSAPRKLLMEIGGIEESFRRWGYEDYDLVRRLRRVGAQVQRDDDILTLHQVHPSVSQLGTIMKAYAGWRQLWGITLANRGKRWGESSFPVTTYEPHLPTSWEPRGRGVLHVN